MKLSVLICTYNRHELLEKALFSIVEGSLEKPEEVVVVNGGSAEADDVVRAFVGRNKVNVHLVKTGNKNLATSRNIGLKHCVGDIIAMTDDDAKVFPDWVEKIKQMHLEHPEAGAVGGAVLGTNTDSLVGKVADTITFPNWPKSRYVRSLPGVNVSYKKEVVERIGSQDETLFRGEDVDYNWRVLQIGYKIYFDPSIKVYHHHRTTLKGFLNQHYMYGRAYYLVRSKWPEMYCVYPHGIHSVRDVLKMAHCLLAIFYQPFLSASRMSGLLEQILSVPVLFSIGVVWKTGMLVQALRTKR